MNLLRLLAHGLKRLVGIVVFLAIVGGLPVGLIILVGWPLPDHWPTRAERAAWLANDQPITARFLIDFAACLVWIMWTLLVGLIGRVEVQGWRERRAWRRHHRPRRHIPVARQGVVGSVVGAFVLGASRAAAAHAGADAAAPATHAPAAAATAPVAGTDATGGQRTYTVQPGDTLWDIAEDQTGDPLQYKQIAADNQGRQEPDGRRFTDPDRIYPHWTLTLPDDQDPAQAPTRTPHPHHAGPHEPSATAPSSPPPTGHADTHHAGPHDSPGRPATPSRRPMQRTSTSAEPSSSGSRTGLPHIGLAAGAVAAFGASLAAAQRHLRWRAAPSTSQARSTGSPAQAARQPRHLARPAARPAAHTDDPPPAIPVALTPTGHHLGLETVGAAGLAWDGPGALPAVRAVVRAALRHPAADLIIAADVLAALLAPEPVPDLPTMHPRIILAANMHDALDRLEAELIGRIGQQGPDSDVDTDAPGGQAGAWQPAALIAAAPGHATGRLEVILAQARGYRLCALLLDTPSWPNSWHIDTDGQVRLATPGTDARDATRPALPGDPIRTEHATTDDLRTALTVSPASPAGPDSAPSATPRPHRPRGSRPPGPDHHPVSDHDGGDPPDAETGAPTVETTTSQRGAAAESATSGLYLQVLGSPVRLTADGSQLTIERRHAADQVLTWLAAHPDGGNAATICADLWPDQPPTTATATLYQAIAAIRRAVRRAGHQSLILSTHRTYRLAPTTPVDLWDLEGLLDPPADSDATDAQRLTRAVRLYRGDLLAGGDDGDWAGPLRTSLRHRLCRALRHLADCQADHPDDAARTLEQILTVTPLDDATWRRLLHVYAGAGRQDEIRHTITLLRAAFTHADLDPHPETLRLAHHLLGDTADRN